MLYPIGSGVVRTLSAFPAVSVKPTSAFTGFVSIGLASKHTVAYYTGSGGPWISSDHLKKISVSKF